MYCVLGMPDGYPLSLCGGDRAVPRGGVAGREGGPLSLHEGFFLG